MKYPALARVFAVVLVIMCLIMAANGAVGLRKTENEYAERLAYVDKYRGRIENYVALTEEVENSISYDEAFAQLQALQEEHDKAASQHRTDTALYTAEKGGNIMGANMIWEAIPEIKDARAELEAGKRELAKQTAEIQSFETAYNENRGTLGELAGSADSSAKSCASEAARLDGVIAEMNRLISAEPQPPASPKPSEEPTEEPSPEPSGEPSPEPSGEPSPEPSQDPQPDPEPDPEPPSPQPSDADPLSAAAAGHQATATVLTPGARPKIRLLSDVTEKDEYEAAMEEYERKHSEWEAECTAFKSTALDPTLQLIAEETAAAAPLAEQLGQIAESLGVDISQIPADMFDNISAALESQMGAGTDPADMSNEEFLRYAQTLRNSLSAVGTGLNQVNGGIAQINAAFAGLATARAEIAMADRALAMAERELYSQLANIWYNLGQLENKAEELAEEKTELDVEAQLLSKKLLETEELRDLKNRHASARQLLLNVPEIKAAYLENDDLPGSAEQYLEGYGAETQRLREGKRLINILAIAGAVAGVLGIPGAFEKTKRRFWLITPVLLCLALAAGADGVNMHMGLGQMYSALITAILALIQLLVILPKQKTISA